MGLEFIVVLLFIQSMVFLGFAAWTLHRNTRLTEQVSVALANRPLQAARAVMAVEESRRPPRKVKPPEAPAAVPEPTKGPIVSTESGDFELLG